LGECTAGTGSWSSRSHGHWYPTARQDNPEEPGETEQCSLAWVLMNEFADSH
jgi:hypothetical protein